MMNNVIILSLVYIIKHHALKICEMLELFLQFLISALDGVEQLASHPDRFKCGEMTPRLPLGKRLGEP
jgi:hypothetical protein